MNAESFEEGIVVGFLLAGDGSGQRARIKPLTVTSNGIYNRGVGVDGFAPVEVNVPKKIPVIQSLTVISNGTYTAPDGVDGYSPVVVNVPDRYDEGYRDGYKDGYDDAKKKYEKIVDTVADNGPVTADDVDELNDLLPWVDFTKISEVTVDGLTGSDTYFRVDRVTNGSAIGLRLVLINKLTGETKVVSTTSRGVGVQWKIESVSFGGTSDRVSVNVIVKAYKDGEKVKVLGKNMMGRATSVGGTSFGDRGAQTVITQTAG